jgi:Family of unknown function (DUF6065)
MPNNIKVYMMDSSVNIEQLKIQRDFFDNFLGETSYKCLPISFANTVGWGISFPEDISFIWDGEEENFVDHVKVLSGEKYFEVRPNKTITFRTGMAIETDENLTTLVTPVPNQFNDGWEVISNVISTSFYRNQLELAIVVLKSNEIITIKANTPIFRILPISLSELNNSSVEVFEWKDKDDSVYNDEYTDEIKKYSEGPKLHNFYKNATNHKGEKIGSHEVDFLNLKTIFRRKSV